MAPVWSVGKFFGKINNFKFDQKIKSIHFGPIGRNTLDWSGHHSVATVWVGGKFFPQEMTKKYVLTLKISK